MAFSLLSGIRWHILFSQAFRDGLFGSSFSMLGLAFFLVFRGLNLVLDGHDVLLSLVDRVGMHPVFVLQGSLALLQ